MRIPSLFHARTRAGWSLACRLVATCAVCGTQIPPDQVMCAACARTAHHGS